MDPIGSFYNQKLSNERQKLVHAGASLDLLFLNGILQDLTSSC